MRKTFQKGDLVRLKNGTAPIVVTNTNGSNYIEGVYLHGKKSTYRHWYDFVDWDHKDEYTHREQYFDDYFNEIGVTINWEKYGLGPDNSTETGENDMNKLYETNEKKPRYGTHIATNSNGQYILEIKGTNGAVEPWDKDNLKEVKPYVVKLRSSVGNCSVYLSAEEGQFVKGEVLIREDVMFVVVGVGVDSKPDNSFKPSQFRRVLTEEIK
jgi:uncharacterized protein YodC (DUF2158 family)